MPFWYLFSLEFESFKLAYLLMFMYLADLFLCFSYHSFLRTDPKNIFKGQTQNGVTTNGNILSCLSFCLLQIFLVCFHDSCREKHCIILERISFKGDNSSKKLFSFVTITLIINEFINFRSPILRIFAIYSFFLFIRF